MTDAAHNPELLFPLPAPTPAATVAAPADPKRGARLREPDRSQTTWGRIDLEAQLPEDHPARSLGAVIARLDLSALYAPVEARDDVAGAPVIDPKLLLATGRAARGRSGG